MQKTRLTAVILVLVISLGMIAHAAGPTRFLQNSLHALVYHAMQIERLFPELDPVGAAIGELGKAIQEEEAEEAYLLLGLIYQNLGLHERAADQYGRFLERNPQEGWVWALLGDAFLALGKYEEAEEAYLASNEHGSYARTFYGLGSVFLDTQDYTAAKEAFEKALEEAPEFVGARVGLGISLYHLGEFEEAVEVLEFSQLMDPRSVEIHRYLALTYDALGRTEQAQHARERIAELAP
ncbi:MAG: tetratricopeptide repeat protein [Firmicutes bacterium]|nr:tetratricopeptide repeat protein [Bacillota bacterium]